MNTQHGHRVISRPKTNSELEDKKAQLTAQWHHDIEQREKYAHKTAKNERLWAYYTEQAAVTQIELDALEAEMKN